MWARKGLTLVTNSAPPPAGHAYEAQYLAVVLSSRSTLGAADHNTGHTKMNKKHHSNEHVVEPVHEEEAEHEAKREHGLEQDQHTTNEDEAVVDEVELEEEIYL